MKIARKAREELAEGARWYEKREGGLGDAFTADVRRVFALIADKPLTFAADAYDVRRVILMRFPYAVLYTVLDSGEPRVIAVAHAKRKPGYWRERP